MTVATLDDGKLSGSLMSQVIHHMKYARFLPHLQRREVFSETVTRNKDMHLWRFPHLASLLHEAYEPVYAQEALPSMRTMQFAGEAMLKNNARGYNCCGCAVDSYEIFSEIFFLLLSGCGVGYSIQEHHVAKLPPIYRYQSFKEHVIPDSIEGWADSVKALLEAFFHGKPLPQFRFHEIRPKGAPLVTSGGKAPGPEPLRRCLEYLFDLLDGFEDGERLQPIHCHHMICIIAEAVLSGGIRRSALISLFSWTDQQMLTCKSGHFFNPFNDQWESGDWYERFPWLSGANNSIVALRSYVNEPMFYQLWQQIEQNGTGEPGIFWTNSLEMFCNPCAEIALVGFCNLAEINASAVTSQEHLDHLVRMAARIATFQASYTDFPYLRPCWKEWAEKDALIGVGMTGIASGQVLNLDLVRAAELVKQENKNIAHLLGINPAARCTTVKPSGTTSLLLGVSSGIHAYWDKYYLRRVTVNHTEPIYKFLSQNCPQILEPHHSPSRRNIDSFITLPLQAPKGAATRDEGAFALLDRVRHVYNDWVKTGHRSGPNTNNVSCTVNVRSSEWSDVGEWMWENREKYAALSVFPFDGGDYKQPPQEAISEEEYSQRIQMLSSFDLRELKEASDGTDLQGEVACAGGTCEIL